MNSEVEELKRKVESLEAVLKSIAEHAAAISRRLKRWEQDGLPESFADKCAAHHPIDVSSLLSDCADEVSDTHSIAACH